MVNAKALPSFVVGWCLATMLLPMAAFAGPPFRTDDPAPVDYRHWEFYTFSTGTHIKNDTSGVIPAFEFNYGIILNGQLHIVARRHSTVRWVVRLYSAMATPNWASNTVSSTKMSTVYDRKLEYFRCLNCRPAVKTETWVQVMSGFIFRSGCKKVTAIGRPTAVADIGSIKTIDLATKTSSSSGGCSNARSQKS